MREERSAGLLRLVAARSPLSPSRTQGGWPAPLPGHRGGIIWIWDWALALPPATPRIFISARRGSPNCHAGAAPGGAAHEAARQRRGTGCRCPRFLRWAPSANARPSSWSIAPAPPWGCRSGSSPGARRSAWRSSSPYSGGCMPVPFPAWNHCRRGWSVSSKPRL